MSSPARIVLVATIAIAVIAAVVLTVGGRPDGAIERAAELLESDSDFATSEDAGATFTRVSIVLQEGGEACLDRGARAQGCDHLFAAAAYARVSAVSLLGCTRRGVAAGRTTLRTFLDALARDPEAPLPDTPACRG